MKGLLLKDLMVLKQQSKIFLLVVALWLGLTVVNRDANFFGGVMMMLSVLVPVFAMAYDEKARWDRYVLTMPVSKKDLVYCKYILMLTGAVLGAFISEIVSVVLTKDVRNSLMMTMVFLSLGVILASVILPIFFRFGVEKGRLIMFLFFMLPSVGAVILSRLGIKLPDAETIEKSIMLLPLAAIGAAVLSMWISAGIYSRKDF